MDSLEVVPPGSRTFWNSNDPTLLDPFGEVTLVPTMASPLSEAACSSTFLFPSTSSTCDSDDSQVRFRARPSLFDESEGASESRSFTGNKAPPPPPPPPEVVYQSSSSSQFNSWVSAPPHHHPGPQGGQGRVHYGGTQLVPEFLGALNSSSGHGSQTRNNNTTSPPSFRRPDCNNSGQLKQVARASWQSANMFEFQRRHKDPLGSPCSVISGFTKVVDQMESYCNMESFGPSTSAAREPAHEPAATVKHRNGSHNLQESNCAPAGVTMMLLKPLSTTKRKRSKAPKLSNEVESQRMTHIAVERNRRKQMNEHLAALRALMPGSYVQKGDQASIVGGAIEFVKELEHLLHCLQAQKRRRAYSELSNAGTPTSRLAMSNPEPQLCQLQPPFSFHNPQRLVDQSPFVLQGGSAQMTGSYGSASNQIQMVAVPGPASSSSTMQAGVLRGLDYCSSSSSVSVGEARSDMASVEVKLVPGSDGAALVKIMALRRAGQLLRTVVALESLALTVLHTNITTVDHTVLYSFHVQINTTGTGADFAPLNSSTPSGLNVDHIAHALHQTFDSLHALQF